jgi:hypothetical protein
VRTFERNFILRALEKGWNVTATAKALGIPEHAGFKMDRLRSGRRAASAGN